ncbi:MAG: hypothetical protein ACE5GR_02640 [Nitrosopumilus sp.]
MEHLPHNNGGGDDLGRYYVNQALEPEYAKPGEPAHIEFSIQDDDGNDVSNVETAVEIYDGVTGQRIELFPWQFHRTGDFEVHYTFEERGNYLVVISLADENSSQEHVIPPRNILLSTLNCDCQRAVFNITITPHIGTIWDSVMLIAILIPLAVFGSVLAMHYLNLRKKGKKPDRPEALKYIVMLLAVAGGIIHLGVYADHGGLRIEYSIFLLVAAATQVAFGTFYVLMTIIRPTISSRQSVLSYYNKTVLLNVIGFVGTAVLLGLYIYVVIFPPPLSPDNRPEEVEYDGVFAKSVEIATIIGIIYLIIYEKEKKKILLHKIST